MANDPVGKQRRLFRQALNGYRMRAHEALIPDVIAAGNVITGLGRFFDRIENPSQNPVLCTQRELELYPQTGKELCLALDELELELAPASGTSVALELVSCSNPCASVSSGLLSGASLDLARTIPGMLLYKYDALIEPDFPFCGAAQKTAMIVREHLFMPLLTALQSSVKHRVGKAKPPAAARPIAGTELWNYGLVSLEQVLLLTLGLAVNRRKVEFDKLARFARCYLSVIPVGMLHNEAQTLVALIA